ncbi:MAG: hypothetical protein NZZ41_05540 [Candidatus Dojkabacteria bacterium]|nr:hypothetical protein [Candidatus Dojkabacteria bacterium]
MSNKLDHAIYNENTKVKVGDIFGAIWGKWEQNVAFFKVVNILSKRTVEVVEIGQKVVGEPKQHSWNVVPDSDKIIGEKFEVRFAAKRSDLLTELPPNPYFKFERVPGCSVKAEKIRDGEVFTVISY